VTFDTSQFVKKELDILGSRNATAADFRAVMDMLKSGGFPVADAVTRVVGLDEAGDALRDWSARPSAITRIHVDLT
jgi:L-galactonate 5-dehydrogenase